VSSCFQAAHNSCLHVSGARHCGPLTRESEAAEQLPQCIIDGAPREVLLVDISVHGSEAQPVRGAQELAHLLATEIQKVCFLGLKRFGRISTLRVCSAQSTCAWCTC